MNILKSIGTVNKPLLLLESYLINRKQQVRVSNTLSKEIIITTGVPRGTILSPVPYLIYITYFISKFKSIRQTISLCGPHGPYTYSRDQCWEEVHRDAETEMRLINTWFIQHNLQINYTKSNFIAFTQDKITQPNFNEIKIYDLKCKINRTINCSCNVL